jgi:hypothetical protein
MVAISLKYDAEKKRGKRLGLDNINGSPASSKC